MTFKTEQEEFWAGAFGTEYINRNKGSLLLASNLELRNGRICRSEALVIVKSLDGNVSRENEDEFCEYLEISRDTYLKIIDTLVNKNIFRTVKLGEYCLREDRR